METHFRSTTFVGSPGEEVGEEGDDADADAKGVAADIAGLQDAHAATAAAHEAGDSVDGAIDDRAVEVGGRLEAGPARTVHEGGDGAVVVPALGHDVGLDRDRKSTRLNYSH